MSRENDGNQDVERIAKEMFASARLDAYTCSHDMIARVEESVDSLSSILETRTTYPNPDYDGSDVLLSSLLRLYSTAGDAYVSVFSEAFPETLALPDSAAGLVDLECFMIAIMDDHNFTVSRTGQGFSLYNQDGKGVSPRIAREIVAKVLEGVAFSNRLGKS